MRAVARWISPQPLAAKVPQIGLLFWVAKLLTTAGGEAFSDFLAHNVVLGAAVDLVLIVTGVFFQFRARRYVAAANRYQCLRRPACTIQAARRVRKSRRRSPTG